MPKLHVPELGLDFDIVAPKPGDRPTAICDLARVPLVPGALTGSCAGCGAAIQFHPGSAPMRKICFRCAKPAVGRSGEMPAVTPATAEIVRAHMAKKRH